MDRWMKNDCVVADGRETGKEEERGGKNESRAPRQQVCGCRGVGAAAVAPGRWKGVIGQLTAICLIPGTVGRLVPFHEGTNIH